MKNIMKEYRKIRNVFFLLTAGFIFTFLLRWGYEVYFSNNDLVVNYSNFGSSAAVYESDSIRKVTNVATDTINQKDLTGQNITIDQKYEKTADLSSDTTDFQNENQKLRQIIKDNSAVVQMENLTGLEGSQLLTMTIGVMPERFEDVVESIKSIGNIKNFTVNKVDKTSEFRNLMAEQETLKKTRDSYIAIKEKGGNIQDLLLLEDKILEVEKNLQNLGVDIGLYSTENSFCTVNFTLHEVAKHEISIRFVFTCAKRSFFWTVMAFALVMFLTFAALAGVAVIFGLLGYIKKIASAANVPEVKNNEEEG